LAEGRWDKSEKRSYDCPPSHRLRKKKDIVFLEKSKVFAGRGNDMGGGR